MNWHGRTIAVAIAALIWEGDVYAAGNARTTWSDYPANWSGDGASLAFSSDRDGNWEIYTVHIASRRVTRVTSNLEVDGNPYFSPDGRSLVFDSRRGAERDVFTIELAPGKIRQITDTPESDELPAWTPDGTGIVHFTKAGEFYELRVHDVAAKATTTLARDFDDDGRLSWSSNPPRVAFIGVRGGLRKLFVFKLDGKSSEHALPIAFAGNASLSPDASTVAFDAHVDGIEASGDGRWEIWSMTLVDGRLTRLTDNDVDDWAPRWSPDGSRLAYLGGGRDNAGYRLRLLDPATGKTELVSDAEGNQ